MKTANEFRMIDEMYALCNKKQYFTCGTNRQYDRMFYMLTSEKYTVRDVAIEVWTCSDTTDSADDIEAEIKAIYEMVEKDAEEEAIEREMEELEKYGCKFEYYA